MRFGLGVSIFGHLAILGFGFVAFPEARPFAPEMIEALPVDLVPIAEVTDLLVGDKNAEALPEDKPQPNNAVQAAAPSPKPAEKPAEKPVEAAAAPAPPPPPPPAPPEPPEPEAAPEPEPEPAQVAALAPPEPAAEEEEAEPLPGLEPAPKVPVQPNVPKPRPDPPKPVAEPKPAPAKPAPPAEPSKQEQERLRQLTETEPKPETFSTDDIAALLDKREPAGGGSPDAAPEPQTLGSIQGEAEAAMTQSELAALQARLYQCWNPPVGVREAGELVVTVRISLLQDGSLATQPQLVSVGLASNPLATVAAESAMRAVVQCSPFGDILRPEKYSLWREIDFVFDPRAMLGG
jgi:hypothetical protein